MANLSCAKHLRANDIIIVASVIVSESSASSLTCFEKLKIVCELCGVGSTHYYFIFRSKENRMRGSNKIGAAVCVCRLNRSNRYFVCRTKFKFNSNFSTSLCEYKRRKAFFEKKRCQRKCSRKILSVLHWPLPSLLCASIKVKCFSRRNDFFFSFVFGKWLSTLFVDCDFYAVIIFRFVGSAIRCWNCSSKFNSGCADPFNNSTMGFLQECLTTISLPNIQTVTQCRKIKHKG